MSFQALLVPWQARHFSNSTFWARPPKWKRLIAGFILAMKAESQRLFCLEPTVHSVSLCSVKSRRSETRLFCSFPLCCLTLRMYFRTLLCVFVFLGVTKTALYSSNTSPPSVWCLLLLFQTPVTYFFSLSSAVNFSDFFFPFYFRCDCPLNKQVINMS